jgi:hypothetical protein
VEQSVAYDLSQLLIGDSKPIHKYQSIHSSDFAQDSISIPIMNPHQALCVNKSLWKTCLPYYLSQGTLYESPLLKIKVQRQSRLYLCQCILTFETTELLQSSDIRLTINNQQTSALSIREPLPFQQQANTLQTACVIAMLKGVPLVSPEVRVQIAQLQTDVVIRLPIAVLNVITPVE